MSIINKAQYFVIQFKVAIELGLAIAGKEGTCPSTTPNGIRVLDASAEVQGPDAKAFGSKVPLALKGLESTVVVTRKLASCTSILNAVLLHEEGHVVLDAVPECGWTMLSAELACDKYMRVRATTKECMAFLAMLEYFNPHMAKSGQVEAYNTNLSRIRSLKSYLGV